jgi:hypothetical protein
MEMGIPSKTQEYDESLQLDLPYHQGIGDCLSRWIQKRQLGKQSKIFDHNIQELNNHLGKAERRLNLGKIHAIHAYRFRHGGASYDFVMKLRDLTSVQHRGRWKSLNSVRRYQKGARLAQLFGALPARRAKTVQSSSKQSGKYLVQGALSQSVCPSLNFPVFIEIFSGSGRLGRAVSQSNGWPVLLWDITLGAEYDLLQQHNRWKITGWLRSGLLRGGHLGTPCNTFTRARDRQPGPPPLRSNEYVMGSPGLSGANLVKVSQGNLFVRFSVQILTLAAILKYPFTMENPANSRIWWVPAVVKILRRRCCQLHFCEFCMFGCPWRKPTAFLSIHCDLSMLDHYRCLGAKRGLCKRSGNKHIPLCGQTSNGVWMTKVAEPYPPKLCKMLAICFANFEAQTRADNFSKRL